MAQKKKIKNLRLRFFIKLVFAKICLLNQLKGQNKNKDWKKFLKS